MTYKLASLPPPPRSSSVLTSVKPGPGTTIADSASPPSSTFGRPSIRTTFLAPMSLLASRLTPESAQTFANSAEVEEETKERYPTAILDTETISDVMAARLVICLLGHVLYLKSQIPFPIVQLLKMSMSGSRKESKSKASKKLDGLLSSFDVLSSHLGTTFTALSTALALGRRRRSRHRQPTEVNAGSLTADENHNHPHLSGDLSAPEEKVHIAFIIGPSVTSASAARARIILEICGLEVKVWGERTTSPRESCSSVVTRRQMATEDLAESRAREEHIDSRQNREDEDEDEDESDSENESVPESDSDYSDISEDEGCERIDTEETLRSAERLLSRTLAIANSDPGLGMAADLQSSQTHILLRAPRRFSHPSWVPRQVLSRDMDKLLSAFDLASEPRPSMKGARRSSQGKVKTECVRISCKKTPVSEIKGVEDKSECAEEEEDEDGQMIWWSWDGKLEGFSEI